MSDQNLAGYALYLMMVFLPGLGLGELLGVWRDGESLAERLGLAFGLGLAFDTLVLFVRTSGASLDGFRMAGIEPTTIYLMIAMGAAFLVAGVAYRRGFGFYVRPRLVDLAVLLVVLGLCGMLAAFFSKYPIFPEYQSPDFANHVDYSTSLMTGASTSIPNGLLYYGVEYQLAASLLLVGGTSIVTVRETMALLVAFSPLVVYLASSRLFSNRIAALLVTAVYTFSGTLWFDSVLNTGLFANFFGFLASLMLLVAFLEVSAGVRSPTRWAFFVLMLVMAYLSHYSTLTLLPALFLVGLLLFAKDRKAGLRFLLPGVVPLVPVVLVAAADPGYVSSVISLAMTGGGQVSGTTALSGFLSSVPVLQYIALEIYDDLAFIVFLALAAVYLYKTGANRDWLLLIPFIWFVSVLVTSPDNINAWRFSFMAILPLTLMAGQGVAYLLPHAYQTSRKRAGYNPPRSARPRAVLTVAVVLCLLVVGSWGTSMLSDASSGTQVVAQSQQAVLQSIDWLSNHTPSGAAYLSVSDWRFTYTNLLIGRTTYYQFESTPGGAIPVARADGAGYVIVTNLITASVPPDPSLFPWNNFSPSPNMSLIYSNPDVEIFQLNESSAAG
ncbi:MAG: hypothetical protein JRN09_03500 [Nitrososphaerota archaeon]|nr:hypothetical protein [Nitrososphaerota archaeon]